MGNTLSEADPVETPSLSSGHLLLYRADIDGLRAIAVLAVVLDHVGVRGLRGGFVGVDIFFVISGYLITGILNRGGYSPRAIADFYKRRVIRIFPALFVMLAATAIVAAFTLLPGELVRFGDALSATALFASNLLFFQSESYFAAASAEKPLLHTWSLAIEEQFYLLWPLLLALVGHRAKGPKLALIAGVTLASLLASMAMVRAAPVAAFYLLPARAWELGAGGMLALSGSRPIRTPWVRETMALFGLMLLLVPIASYSWATPFPGLAALPPCLGTMLVIGAQGGYLGRVLSLRPLVAVGRMSYSLYLWHWPVIVFARIALFLPPRPIVKMAELAVALLLGWASWRFIEKPVRQRGAGVPPRRVLIAGGIAMLAALTIGLLLRASNGLPGRFTPVERALAAYEDMDGNRAYRGGSCFLVEPGDRFDAHACLRRPADGRPVLLLVGDSHAAHLWPGLAIWDGRRFDVMQATSTGCEPLLAPAAGRSDCAAFFGAIFEALPRIAPDALLLAARWRPADLDPLARTLADPRIRAAHPILIGPVPQYMTTLPRLLVRAERTSDPALPARSLAPEPFAVDTALRNLARRTNVPYISPIAILCRKSTCRTLAAPGVPLQFDYGHLTPAGSRLLINAILPQIETMTGPRATENLSGQR